MIFLNKFKVIPAIMAFLLMGVGLNSMMASAASTNLIKNPSVETAASATKPTNWASSKYGTNSPTYQYLNSGCQKGNRCLGITMTGYVSGDAKWHFTPVQATPSTAYTFSDWYQSSVSTNLDAQITTSTGETVYIWLGTLPSSSTWHHATFNFTTPANAAKITVFHEISANGNLKTDNFSLTLTPSATPTPSTTPSTTPTPSATPTPTPSPTATPTPTPSATPTPTPTPSATPTPTPSPTPSPSPSPSPTPVPGNIVPNPGVETNNGSSPTDWDHGKWGSNSPTFEYPSTGHTGDHSAQVTMTGWTSGDAKWYFTPQNVTAGGTYEFSDWYKSNVSTELDAAITLSDGTIKYMWLTTVDPSSDWMQIKKQFALPTNATQVTVYHVIATNGVLTTDDFALTPVNVNDTFNRGLVSVTLDDGYGSQYTNAQPILSNYAIPATFYIICGTFTQNPAYMTSGQIQALGSAGQEIAAHTNTHPHMTTLTPDQRQVELAGCQTTLRNLTGQPVADFAWPYGENNAATTSEAAQYYDTLRTTQTGFNTKANLDKLHLQVQNVYNTTTTSEVQSWLNQAAANKSWLILVYHEVANSPVFSGDDTYTTSVANFNDQMTAVKNSGLGMVTIRQAITEINPQP